MKKSGLNKKTAVKFQNCVEKMKKWIKFTSLWQTHWKHSLAGTLHSQPLSCRPGVSIPPPAAHLAVSHVSVGSMITRTTAVSASRPFDHPNGFLQQWVCFMSWFGRWGLVCFWGGAVSSGFQNIRGGVMKRPPKNVKGETLRPIKLNAAVRWNPPKSFPESKAAPLDEEESLL